MADLTTVIGLAVALTVGIMSVMLNFYFSASNPFIKAKVMRYISGKGNWGVWALVVKGRGMIYQAVPFNNKDKAFKDSNGGVYPVGQPDEILSVNRMPFQCNYIGDATPLRLIPLNEVQKGGLSDPDTLQSWCEINVALAEARAERKSADMKKIMTYILYAVIALGMLNLYYGYHISDMVSHLLPQVASKDALGNLIPVMTGGK